MVERLDTPYVTGYFDEEDKLLKVTYRGTLTSEVTNTVYRWLAQLISASAGDISGARGSIYDFRELTAIDMSNLLAAQQNSTHLNVKFDMRNHPVALIVGTDEQRDFVKLTMHVTPEETRKKIVTSIVEAQQFIDEFHQNQASEQDK